MTRDKKVMLGLTQDELAEIDEYRFSSRSESRSEAIRKLIEMGKRYLEAEQSEMA